MELLTGAGIFLILGIVLVVGLIIAGISFFIMRTWIKVAKADEALVISGNKKDKTGDSKLEVITNGRALVNPITRRHEVISLRSRKVELNVGAQSLDGVTLQVKASALVKIDSSEEKVIRAAERFASQDEAIEMFTQDQLEGALRGVVALLNVVDLMKDRKKFSDQIADSVSDELSNQGLHLDSFQITDISDAAGYIKSLGTPEIEEKKQAAAIAATQAARNINKQKISTDEENLIEQTAYEQNRANAAAEVGRARAEAEQAEALAKARAEQSVLHQKAENKQAALEAEVNKVADAERYKKQQEADANAYSRTKQAEAEKAVSETQAAADATVRQRKADADAYEVQKSAEARSASAAADAEAIRVKADAEADALRKKAQAESEAIRLNGTAKAEAIKAEAEALRENQEAVLARDLVSQLPAMMEQWAKGYERMGKITMIGGGSANNLGSPGEQPAMAMVNVFETVKAATGIDLGDIIKGRAIGQGIASGNDDSTYVDGSTED